VHPPDDDVNPHIGKHRRPAPFHPRHRRVETARRRPGRRRSAAVLLAVAAAVFSASSSAAERPTDGAASVALSAEVSPASEQLKERARAADTTSRGAARAAAPSPPAPTASEPAASVAQAPPEPPPQAQPRAVEASASPAPTPPPKPAPVGGLNQRQMDHAAVIVAMGQRAGLPERAYIVAIATALQESNLRNLANPVYPASLNLPNDGTGYDHDSVGLFQQRPSTGWGTVSQIMDPAYSATKFYEALARVSGWEDLPVTVAAQRVQVSAYPDHYAKHELLARQIVAALT
jgi:hypothetical protein